MSKRLRVDNAGAPLPAFTTVPPRPVPDATRTVVADGIVVEDLGDSFECAKEFGDSITVRKVRSGGTIVWLPARWIWSTGLGQNRVAFTLLVDAPLTITSGRISP